MNCKPENIPDIVGQALVWLDKMKISYRYVPESRLWEFVYDGLYMLLINDCEDDELCLYAPMMITDTDDEEIRQMVYDCSVPMFEHEFSSNCDYGYDGDGVCHLSQCWGFRGEKPRLLKKIFVEKLRELHDYQIKTHFILKCTYEGMFNPPPEIMREIFKDLKPDDSDE